MQSVKKYKLGELCTDVSYGYTESAKQEKIGPKFLRITDIQNDHINWNAVPYCPITDADFKKYKLNIGDIVIARTGNSTGATSTIKEEVEAVFASYLIRFRLNKEIANPFYVDFVLRSNLWQNFVESIKGGSAQPGANAKQLSEFEFDIPDLPTQSRIASILSSFDDKIELNRRTNQTLEQIAQTLFKKYFVDDIDPENLPERWELKCVYDLALFVNGAAFKNSDFSKSKEALPIIKIVELKYGITSTTMFSKKPLDEKYKIENGDILFSWSGSPDTSIDTFLWVNGTAWLNQHIFKIVTDSVEMRTFVYYLLKFLNPVFIDIAKNKQTTGLGHVTINDLRRLKVAFPNSTLLSDFASKVTPIMDCIQNNLSEIKQLTKIRDSLLPKLMSGEIDVH